MNNTSNIDTIEQKRSSLKKRYRKEKRFRLLGILAVSLSFAFLLTLLVNITYKGLPAFTQYYAKFEVNIDPSVLEIDDKLKGKELTEALEQASYRTLVNKTLYEAYPQFKTREQKKILTSLISAGFQYDLRGKIVDSPKLIGKKHTFKFLLNDDVDTFLKIDGFSSNERNGRLNQEHLSVLKLFKQDGRITRSFSKNLFFNSDSRNPGEAGVKGAVIGSLLTILITFVISFPVGLFAAIYLEEFAPKNKFTDFIEININNLAAVPSIVFGLLGLAVFIGLFGMPRSAPLIGGLVLTLMTLPTIIISSRAAIKAVPPSLKDAAIGLGASHSQTIFHHTVPAAMPGVLTGAIIGMAQAIGETAPLLMIGMVAFIVDIPHNFTDPATVLPVQIYLWAGSPERAFVAKTSAAILLLLGFLLCINLLAILLRKKFENRGK